MTVIPHRFKRGMNTLARQRFPTGQVQHRHRICKRLRHTPKRIFRTGTLLHRKNAKLFSVGHATKTIGHIDARALLTTNNRGNSRLSRGFNKVLMGKSHQKFNAFCLEHTRHSIVTSHRFLRFVYCEKWINCYLMQGRSQRYSHCPNNTMGF